jgi:hypothetical protein
MSARNEIERDASLSGGCLIACASALLTGFMLFINGSFVLALLSVLSKVGPAWTNRAEFSQFLLFIMPVLLVIAQWMMIDYVRSRLRQPPADE